MNVRSKREGVEEVFAQDRVCAIMQEALSKRYSPVAQASGRSSNYATSAAERMEESGDATPMWTTSSASTASWVSREQRLCIPRHYTLRRHSRTEHFLCPLPGLCGRAHHPQTTAVGPTTSSTAPSHTPSASPCLSGSEQANARVWWCEEEACVARAVVAECLRHHTFHALAQTDLRRVCGLPDTAGSRAHRDCDGAPLATWQEFFELPPRWVMQSLGAVDRHTFASDAAWRLRRSVTPLDVGATVVRRADAERTTTTVGKDSAAPHYRVVATATMSRGAYWVEIAPVAADAWSSQDRSERVDREAVWLDPPAPLHVDALLPCDELYSDRGVSTSTYVFFLRALQQQQRGQQKVLKRTRSEKCTSTGSSSSNDFLSKSSLSSNNDGSTANAATLAADLALQLARSARQRRDALAAALEHWQPPASPRSGTVTGRHADVRASAAPRAEAAGVMLQVRVDTARDCLQLRARWTGQTSDVTDRLRRSKGHDAEVLDERHAESPTVEVLLRSARKLAALYDLTRAAAAEALLWQHPSDKSAGSRQSSAAQNGVNHHGSTSEHVSLDLHGSDVPSLPICAAGGALEQLLQLFTTEGGGASGQHRPGAAVTATGSSWHTVVFNAHEQQSSAGTAALSSPGKAFLARLFTLLLRYRSLFGEQGYNQGPQAAVPPSIMEELAQTFDIRAEAFASPLNAQLPQFGSLFPDTDAYFGSMGSFFDLMLGSSGRTEPSPPSSTVFAQRAGASDVLVQRESGCHVEVNPPFDTTLLRHMEEHLLTCLQRAETSAQSLLFLIVLPSHDVDAEEMMKEKRPALHTGASRTGCARHPGTATAAGVAAAAPVSTDRSLRESSFCLGHVLCAASESVYVDGHQHLLASPFFCIGTPTRLILLGNAAARARFPLAATQLDGLRQSWKRLTESAMRKT